MTTIPVSGASPATTSTASSATDAAAKASVDYDSFLRLLVAEMKNQDPTNPMDSSQYVAQLATFSQVEQSIQTNSKLDQLLQMSTLSQADAVIGRHITSADGSTSGVVAEVRLTSEGAVAVLENGEEVNIQSGITVAAAQA